LKGGIVLKHDHGSVVQYDLDTLAGLCLAGKADPELLRESVRRDEAKRLALPSEGFVAAAGPDVAAAPYPGAIVNPIGPPTITGTTFTIDFALANPTRVITPMVLDLTAARFFVDRVFTSAGGVTGGAVIYDVVIQPDRYADRDIQQVTPGTEFPIVAFSRRAPQVAVPEKWGAKFFFTDEARDRNDTGEFTRAMRQLANTIVRKINQRGVQVLEAFITANARTVTGNNWSAVNTLTGTGGSNYNLYPARDLAKADLQADQEEMGIDYNLWIMNPYQMFELEGIYGDKLAALLASFGISVFVTNRVADGTAYALSEGNVGEMRLEKPLSSETWRDPNGKEQTWVQTSVRPLMYANNAFAVLKFVQLHG
jgi:hypothetical protein